MKEFITIEHKEINDKVIFFKSNCTIYANVRKVKIYNASDLLKRCTKICKIVKGLNCKVSHKNKSRLFVKENIDLYNQEKTDYMHNYDMLKNYALWITSKPLPVGTSDNEELNTMYEFSNKINKACYRSTTFSKVNDFGNKLDEIEKLIQDGDFNYSMITF